MRGAPTLGPYSRMDMRLGRLAESGLRFIDPDMPSTSKLRTATHRVSSGQMPLMVRHLLRLPG